MEGAAEPENKLGEAGGGQEQRNERIRVGSRAAFGSQIEVLDMPAVRAWNVLKETLEIGVAIELNMLSKKL